MGRESEFRLAVWLRMDESARGTGACVRRQSLPSRGSAAGFCGRTLVCWVCALVLAAVLLPAQGQSRFSKGGPPVQQDAGGEDEPIAPTGLKPVYPAQARCAEIVSLFGAQTRYDGSMRQRNAFGGYHGGIDITLPEGTPLLALAAGTVVSAAAGGLLEGNYL